MAERTGAWRNAAAANKDGSCVRRPEARESLKIPLLKCVVTGFEVMMPVTSMAGFGLGLASGFVLPLKWSLLADD